MLCTSNIVQLHQIALLSLANRNGLNFWCEDTTSLHRAGIIQFPSHIGRIMRLRLIVRIVQDGILVSHAVSGILLAQQRRAKPKPTREFLLCEESELRLRQIGRAHQIPVALARGAAAFVEGPHYEALAAAAIAGGENAFDVRGIFLEVGLRV